MTSVRGPGVFHVIANFSEALSQSVARNSDLTEKRAKFLVRFGAVYLQRPSVDPKPRRILDEACIVQQDDYIRVYSEPKIYNDEDVDWEKCILYEDEKFLLVNKPGGLPCHPTNDNMHQNVVEHLRKIRPDVENLYAAHRLDTATSGLLVIAKTAKFTAEFHKMQQTRGVINKQYCALVGVKSQPLVPGTLTHFLKSGRALPREFCANIPTNTDTSTTSTWQECQLEILSARSVVPRDLCEFLSFFPLQKMSQNSRFQEVKIRLLTGRTHQIRGQLAALGCPIVGDEMYHDADIRASDPEIVLDLNGYDATKPLCLQSSSVNFPYTRPNDRFIDAQNFAFSLESAWWSKLLKSS
jgi:23S rRNA-/tRNA-specific pseudouridylate synthase